MRGFALSIAAVLLFTGCMKAQESSTRALDDVEDSTSSSWHKMREMLDLGGKPKPKKTKPVQPRYCYHTLGDVVCYSSPIAGQEDRLIAYQDNDSTGYTIAPPPPPATKKTVTIKKTKTVTSTPATLDAPAATTVFTEKKTETTTVTPGTAAPMGPPLPAMLAKPPEVKKDSEVDQRRLKEITFDPSELEPKKLVPDKMQ